MRSHPDTLELLLLRHEVGNKKALLYPVDAGFAAAFLRVCEELEPELRWSDDGDRVTWLELFEELRYAVHRFRGWRATIDVAHPELGKSVLERLCDLAKKSWSGPRTSTSRQLSFVQDSGLRRIAERDLAYIAIARQHEEAKVALVLAGCVVEAVLADLHDRWPRQDLLAAASKVQQAREKSNPRVWGKGFDPCDPKKWKLVQMVGVSGQQGLGVLSERTEQVANVLREWRNFVHPREEASDAPLQLRDATVAEALVEGVLEEVEKAQKPQIP